MSDILNATGKPSDWPNSEPAWAVSTPTPVEETARLVSPTELTKPSGKFYHTGFFAYDMAQPFYKKRTLEEATRRLLRQEEPVIVTRGNGKSTTWDCTEEVFKACNAERNILPEGYTRSIGKPVIGLIPNNSVVFYRKIEKDAKGDLVPGLVYKIFSVKSVGKTHQELDIADEDSFYAMFEIDANTGATFCLNCIQAFSEDAHIDLGYVLDALTSIKIGDVIRAAGQKPLYVKSISQAGDKFRITLRNEELDAVYKEYRRSRAIEPDLLGVGV